MFKYLFFVFLTEALYSQNIIKNDCFKIPVARFSNAGEIGHFLCAIDTANNLAIASSSSQTIYFFTLKGKLIDSVSFGFFPRNLLFNSKNILLASDINESKICQYNMVTKLIIQSFYNKPEELLKKEDPIFVNYFDDIIFTPTYYFDTTNINIKLEYGTRFSYNYNFFPDYFHSEIYQVLNGAIYKVYGTNNIFMKNHMFICYNIYL